MCALVTGVQTCALPISFAYRWTQLPCSSQQPSSCHPQVRRGEQHEHLRGVLRQAAITHLGVAKLPLDHPKRVLHPRPHLGFEMLQALYRFLVLALGEPLYRTATLGDPPRHRHTLKLCPLCGRADEHTSELKPLMRISYA